MKDLEAWPRIELGCKDLQSLISPGASLLAGARKSWRLELNLLDKFGVWATLRGSEWQSNGDNRHAHTLTKG